MDPYGCGRLSASARESAAARAQAQPERRRGCDKTSSSTPRRCELTLERERHHWELGAASRRSLPAATAGQAGRPAPRCGSSQAAGSGPSGSALPGELVPAVQLRAIQPQRCRWRRSRRAQRTQIQEDRGIARRASRYSTCCLRLDKRSNSPRKTLCDNVPTIFIACSHRTRLAQMMVEAAESA